MGKPIEVLIAVAVMTQACSALWLGECNKPLGVSTGGLEDSALSASSSHNHIVGPHRARLGMDGTGGAWCPRSMVDAGQGEWLEVDLGSPRLVTAVATQGRQANGQGVEYTPAYTLSYWRPGMASFVSYTAHPSLGNKTLLVGNSDTYTEVKNVLERPLFASRVRLEPFSAHPRVVCVRLELYGCNYTDGMVSYIVGGSKSSPGAGVGEIMGVGEGLLYDGRVGGDEMDEFGGAIGDDLFPPATLHEPHDHRGDDDGDAQVEGLEPAPDTPLSLVFNFDVMRRFKTMYVYLTTSHQEQQPAIKAAVKFGANSSFFDDVAVTSTWSESDLIPTGPQNLTFDLRKRPGASLQVTLEVRAMEVSIQEIYFDSSPCGCGLGDWERRPPTLPEEHTASRPPAASPPSDVWAVYTAHQHRTYVGVAVGFSVGVGVLVLVWAGVWLRRRRGKASSPRVFRRPPPDTLDMKSLMEGVGVSSGLGMMGGGSSTPTYEEGSCLLYDDLQKTPLVSTLPHCRPRTPDSNATPVYATPTLRPSSTFPSAGASFCPIPRPVTLASLPRPPPIPPPPERCDRQMQVPSVTGPWLTSVYRQDAVSQVASLTPPIYAPTLPAHQVTRTQILGSGAFSTLSVGVVSCNADAQLDDEVNVAPPPRPAALITVSAHEVAPAATRQAQLLASLNHENVTQLMGVVVGGPVGVTLVLEYYPDAHLPEYLRARSLAPAQVEGGRGHDSQTISVSGLVSVASQIASAMKYLESRHIIHTDLAARNVVMAEGVAKVTQVGSALPRYSQDYWRSPDGRGPAPLRWISPEALCQGTFTHASDIWAFGVTLWEVLTLSRRRPHHHLSEDLLFHALVSTHNSISTSSTSSTLGRPDTYAKPQVVLSAPAWCPREIQELMTACWHPRPAHRPSFNTIHATLAAYAHAHN
ncbi:discoidin domain-containing receptor 2-like [Penaeus japonicus]|uniref:discoidin domain-containing receptor 2-like n=1 Tax=Penaeus japonicus TaxID=27405 RepID=UPI001C713C51|nr:discoidin domain-containing receptor 2-like [Penaeus japonicus]XP_042863297.1 discoidin domain-containing receptor 2-like [Penaeus japonicus]